MTIVALSAGRKRRSVRMSVGRFFDRLESMPAGTPALVGEDGAFDYPRLLGEVARVATMLRANRTRVLGTLLDNGPAWVVADLAALAQGVVHVPIPTFFTPRQAAYALDAAAVDTVLGTTRLDGFESTRFTVTGASLELCFRRVGPLPLHAGTAKITFTSGTTGTPKGVCLSGDAMMAVASGLAEALRPTKLRTHLCALPLAVLLENVAGVYAPMLSGAASVVVPTARVGLLGSSRFDPAELEGAVRRYGAESVIVLPQMLRAWTAWRASRTASLAAPRFVAVGGAAVGAAAIARARVAGLPAYEGYGLSEGASVQTLNLPDADRTGSAGRALPHAKLRAAPDGEIEIAGSVMLGYLGESPIATTWLPTGDVGSIDADGFVHLRGRKKHVIITAFGRNVSPEWVESLLHAQPVIAQAVVQGDGKPRLEAVLWPMHEAVSDADLARAVEHANAELPDYARVRRFVRARAPFTPTAGTCTPNGRPLRKAIQQLHAAAFAASERFHDAVL